MFSKWHKKGFTLIELIITIVVTAILAIIIVPSYNYLIYKSKYNVTVLEAQALAREAKYNALYKTRTVIIASDFGDNDMNKYMDGVDRATGSPAWPYTSIHNITVYIDENGEVSSIPTNSGSDLGITSTDGTTVISGSGTFTDTFNDVNITKTTTDIKIHFNRANWLGISINYGNITDTLYKTTGGSTVGVITKNSNNDITVTLPQSSTFTINIKYNGSSSGVTCTIQ